MSFRIVHTSFAHLHFWHFCTLLHHARTVHLSCSIWRRKERYRFWQRERLLSGLTPGCYLNEPTPLVETAAQRRTRPFTRNGVVNAFTARGAASPDDAASQETFVHAVAHRSVGTACTAWAVHRAPAFTRDDFGYTQQTHGRLVTCRLFAVWFERFFCRFTWVLIFRLATTTAGCVNLGVPAAAAGPGFSGTPRRALLRAAFREELQGVFISSHEVEIPVNARIWISRGKSSRFSHVLLCGLHGSSCWDEQGDKNRKLPNSSTIV